MFSSLNIKVKSDSESSQKPEAKEEGPLQQPVLMIIQKTMPIFKEVAALWINENKVIEVIQSLIVFGQRIFSLETMIFFILGFMQRLEVRDYKFNG